MKCGAKIDLYPKMPGNLVMTCAREEHSKRAWHKTADDSFAWKDKKVEKPKPKPPCDWFSWGGGSFCEDCGGDVVRHKGLRWPKPGSSPFSGPREDVTVEWKDYGPDRTLNVPLLTHAMGEELFERLHANG